MSKYIPHIPDGNTYNPISAVSIMNVDGTNEILPSDIGDKTKLATTDKSSFVNAINENANKIGVLSTLNTTNKTSLVNAVNENVSQISDIVINISKFPKLVSEIDDTNRIQRAINFIQTNYPQGGVLNFQSGNYYVSGNLYITSLVELRGVYGNPDAIVSKSGNFLGTVINDTSTTNSNPLLTISAESNNAYTDPYSNRIHGFRMSGLVFYGNGSNRDCLRLCKTNHEFHITDVFISDYKGRGIHFLDCFDGTLNGVTLWKCGGKISSSDFRYAMDFDTQTIENTNAIHLFGCRIEQTRYYINFGNARFIQFIGCKFEMNVQTGINDDLLNPFFKYGSNCGEVTFDGCMFPCISVETFISQYQLLYSVAITPSQVPYIMQGITNTNANNNVKLMGCDVANGASEGVKFLKSNGCIFNIIGGKYAYLTGKDYAIDLDNGQITNAYLTFIVKDEGSGIGGIKGLNIKNSIVDQLNINVLNPNSITVSTTTLFNLNSDCYVGKYKSSYIFTNKFIFTDNMKNKFVYRKKDTTAITSFTGDTIDLNKYDTTIFYFNLSSPLVINSIINGYNGEKITIWNNSSNSITINNNTVSGVRTGGTGTSLVLNVADCVELEFIEYVWRVRSVSRWTQTY